MAVDYNDPRFAEVERSKQQALNNANNTYNEMINKTDSQYQGLIDATKEYADTQQKLQQQQTDFTVEKINQQKDQAEKDYIKEQKGAYVDYQKASNQYGANAEAMASQGMSNTGYSESSKVSMYNTYQNRYATARESYNKAILNYDNAIKEAMLANSSALADIAFKALQSQLQLSLEGFQYKNSLLQQQLNTQLSIDSEYYGRWQNVLNQINTENSLAEQIRQYNQSLAEEQRQFNESMAYKKAESAREQANWQKEYELSKSKISNTGSSISKGTTSTTTSKNTGSTNAETIEKIENFFKYNIQAFEKQYIEKFGNEKGKSLVKERERDFLNNALKTNTITEAEFLKLAEKYQL